MSNKLSRLSMVVLVMLGVANTTIDKPFFRLTVLGELPVFYT